MNPHRRADVAEIRTEFLKMMTELRTEFKQDVTELRTEFKQDVAELRTEFKQDVAELRSTVSRIHVPYNDARLAGVEKQIGEIGSKITYLTDAHERFVRAVDKYEQDGGNYPLMVSFVI